jgi:hypothetical protein
MIVCIDIRGRCGVFVLWCLDCRLTCLFCFAMSRPAFMGDRFCAVGFGLVGACHAMVSISMSCLSRLFKGL